MAPCTRASVTFLHHSGTGCAALSGNAAKGGGRKGKGRALKPALQPSIRMDQKLNATPTEAEVPEMPAPENRSIPAVRVAPPPRP